MMLTADRLIHLLRFYGIHGYEEWGMDADSLDIPSDSDDSDEGSSTSSRLPMRLDTAVRSYPEIAHRALGAQLGLSYDDIQRFMERAQELSRAPAKQTDKRGQDEQTSEGRKRRKGRRTPDENLTEVTSPSDPRSSQGKSSQGKGS